MSKKPLALVVLISGNGSNLQAIIDAINTQQLQASVKAVISNQPSAHGLRRAFDAEINTHTLDHRQFAHRAQYDAHLAEIIQQYQPDYVILAGFMRILSPLFIQTFAGKIINIHPSLLPAYPGLHTHRSVLASGDMHHGATVHFVTENLDSGPGIIQGVLTVQKNETEENLVQRIHAIEHIIYPKAIEWLANHRISLQDGKVYLDGEPLGPGGYPMHFNER